jgi:hypothetical protein
MSTRILALLLPLFLTVPNAGAQSQSALEVGSRVRILFSSGDGGPAATLAGTFEGNRADTLLIQDARVVAPREVPVAWVREVAVSRGHRTHARGGARVGAVAGALILGSAIYLDERSSETCATDCVYDNPSLVPMTIFGLAAGALGGWFVGERIGSVFRTERWERIGVERLGVRGSRDGWAVELTF